MSSINIHSKGPKDSCPYIETPHKECYCFEINSSKVPKAIKYCANHYRLCPVYQKIGAAVQNQHADFS